MQENSGHVRCNLAWFYLQIHSEKLKRGNRQVSQQVHDELRYIRKAHPFNVSVVRWYECTYVWAKGFWKTQMCDLDDV